MMKSSRDEAINAQVLKRLAAAEAQLLKEKEKTGIPALGRILQVADAHELPFGLGDKKDAVANALRARLEGRPPKVIAAKDQAVLKVFCIPEPLAA